MRELTNELIDDDGEPWLERALKDHRISDFTFRVLAHVHLVTALEGRLSSVLDVCNRMDKSGSEVRAALREAALLGYVDGEIVPSAPTHGGPESIN